MRPRDPGRGHHEVVMRLPQKGLRQRHASGWRRSMLRMMWVVMFWRGQHHFLASLRGRWTGYEANTRRGCCYWSQVLEKNIELHLYKSQWNVQLPNDVLHDWNATGKGPMASSKPCTCGRQRGKPFRPLSADVGARGPHVTKRLPFSCLPAGCNTTAASQPRNLCLAFVVNEEGFRFTESSLWYLRLIFYRNPLRNIMKM